MKAFYLNASSVIKSMIIIINYPRPKFPLRYTSFRWNTDYADLHTLHRKILKSVQQLENATELHSEWKYFWVLWAFALKSGLINWNISRSTH